MYNTYIFDLYGTLIDIRTDEDDPRLWETLSVHFRYKGMEITGPALQKRAAEETERQLEALRSGCEYPDFVLEKVLEAVADGLGVKVSAGWLNETVRWFRTLSMRHLALYDGVEEVLTALRSQGKKIYLLSNGQKTFIEAELGALGILDRFDGIAISSEAGLSKPDPLFYRYLQRTYGADLTSALMVGNDPRTDLEGARRAGIDGCYLHTESSPRGMEVTSAYQIWDGDIRRIPGWR
ncbi:HAD family hydrolase [Paenibacillus spiritus]|uniref:HAD family hydrolase n=1 Tax=Paenibacillus spiritus TaxID=2496557 RepID=A0A5J5GB39_9BACL|nr:HAD family hydrolase [Paenibacillus spiritus]KAA9005032.1 HAD family hydrolase [Paenibacillus spiritus]